MPAMTSEILNIRPKDLAPPSMTFEEFLEWSDGVHAEWVDGKVTFLLSASDWHQQTIGLLFALFRFWLDVKQPGGRVWMAGFLMRCRAGMPGREPDILYVREENLGKVRTNYLEGAADIAIEVVSPESVQRDFMEKFAEYETGGVGEYWVIDPATGVAEFYVRDTPNAPHFRRATLTGATAEKRGVYTCETLGGLSIDVDWLFARPLPSLVPIIASWNEPSAS